MIVKNAEFITSAVNYVALPKDGKPEIMLCGRSNVGKSSLINLLCNRKKLARTSQTPGKTQTLNIYLINQDFYFVDVPGYGYSATGKSLKNTFGKMIETYVKKREELKMAFLLVDSRHEPTNDDYLMFQFLKQYVENIVIIATKCDKLNAKEKALSKKTITNKLELTEFDTLIYASSLKRIGIDEIYNKIDEVLINANKENRE